MENQVVAESEPKGGNGKIWLWFIAFVIVSALIGSLICPIIYKLFLKLWFSGPATFVIFILILPFFEANLAIFILKKVFLNLTSKRTISLLFTITTVLFFATYISYKSFPVKIVASNNQNQVKTYDFSQNNIIYTGKDEKEEIKHLKIENNNIVFTAGQEFGLGDSNSLNLFKFDSKTNQYSLNKIPEYNQTGFIPDSFLEFNNNKIYWNAFKSITPEEIKSNPNIDISTQNADTLFSYDIISKVRSKISSGFHELLATAGDYALISLDKTNDIAEETNVVVNTKTGEQIKSDLINVTNGDAILGGKYIFFKGIINSKPNVGGFNIETKASEVITLLPVDSSGIYQFLAANDDYVVYTSKTSGIIQSPREMTVYSLKNKKTQELKMDDLFFDGKIVGNDLFVRAYSGKVSIFNLLDGSKKVFMPDLSKQNPNADTGISHASFNDTWDTNGKYIAYIISTVSGEQIHLDPIK